MKSMATSSWASSPGQAAFTRAPHTSRVPQPLGGQHVLDAEAHVEAVQRRLPQRRHVLLSKMGAPAASAGRTREMLRATVSRSPSTSSGELRS